jgi:hypothetical protein
MKNDSSSAPETAAVTNPATAPFHEHVILYLGDMFGEGKKDYYIISKAEMKCGAINLAEEAPLPVNAHLLPLGDRLLGRINARAAAGRITPERALELRTAAQSLVERLRSRPGATLRSLPSPDSGSAVAACEDADWMDTLSDDEKLLMAETALIPIEKDHTVLGTPADLLTTAQGSFCFVVNLASVHPKRGPIQR